MSLALSKGTCGRTFGMANQSGGRAILCRKRASGRHHMDKTGRKTGNQWLTKAGNDKEDTYAMACILLKSIGAPGRNRTHGPQLRRLLLYPTELLAHRKPINTITDCACMFIRSKPRIGNPINIRTAGNQRATI